MAREDTISKQRRNNDNNRENCTVILIGESVYNVCNTEMIALNRTNWLDWQKPLSLEALDVFGSIIAFKNNTNCVTQLKLYTLYYTSWVALYSVVCLWVRCQALVSPDQISTFSDIYRHKSPILTLYQLIRVTHSILGLVLTNFVWEHRQKDWQALFFENYKATWVRELKRW